MQPSEPLNPGETYYDKDLDIEVVAVESTGCSIAGMECVYCGRCKTIRSCSTPYDLPDVVYLPKLQYATFKLTQLVI